MSMGNNGIAMISMYSQDLNPTKSLLNLHFQFNRAIQVGNINTTGEKALTREDMYNLE